MGPKEVVAGMGGSVSRHIAPINGFEIDRRSVGDCGRIISPYWKFTLRPRRSLTVYPHIPEDERMNLSLSDIFADLFSTNTLVPGHVKTRNSTPVNSVGTTMIVYLPKRIVWTHRVSMTTWRMNGGARPHHPGVRTSSPIHVQCGGGSRRTGAAAGAGGYIHTRHGCKKHRQTKCALTTVANIPESVEHLSASTCRVVSPARRTTTRRGA